MVIQLKDQKQPCEIRFYLIFLILLVPLKNKPSKQECNDPYFVLNPVMSPESISPVPPTVIEGVVLSITKVSSPSETIF